MDYACSYLKITKVEWFFSYLCFIYLNVFFNRLLWFPHSLSFTFWIRQKRLLYCKIIIHYGSLDLLTWVTFRFPILIYFQYTMITVYEKSAYTVLYISSLCLCVYECT